MRDEDELRDILAALDQDDAPDEPPYADRLWAEVRGTLERSGAADGADSAAETVALTPRQSASGSTRPGRVAAITGAIAAALLLFVVFAVQRDAVTTDPTPPAATRVPAPTATPALITPPDGGTMSSAEACAAYSAGGATLRDLAAALEAGTGTQASIDAAFDALAELRLQLAAAGDFDDGELAGLDQAVRTLGQAELELAAGDAAAAARTVNTAAGQVTLSLPPADGEVVQLPCVTGD